MKRLDVLQSKPNASTINPCRLCAPLGASLAVRGIAQAMPILHGSQGCATYIRRYLVSHFREPMDVASSSFGENEAIFGGASNLGLAIDNVVSRYQPELVAVATTCLAETIGDDVPGIVKRWVRARGAGAPAIVHASTAAYSGSHAEGFTKTVLAIVEQLAEASERSEQINLFAPMSASPADIRYLRRMAGEFGVAITVVPDISDTLDGPSWEKYESIPSGGTTLTELRATGSARASLSFEGALGAEVTVGKMLEKRFSVTNHDVGMPIGIEGSDRLVEALSQISGQATPRALTQARGRLVDAMVDGHKIFFERKVGIVGDPELVVGLVAFCRELGMIPALVASGGNPGRLRKALDGMLTGDSLLLEDSDHDEIAETARLLGLDVLIGPSKVRSWARHLEVPLVHLGFPIHDRFGASRLQTFGYEGTLQLLDRVINALLERRQSEAGLGWAYL